ncbi:hypothetical protein TU82_06845 [Pseudomonas orientalis]|nr:hypothetical protein TU82_06845 [Pseudomonas orientalis]
MRPPAADQAVSLRPVKGMGAQPFAVAAQWRCGERKLDLGDEERQRQMSSGVGAGIPLAVWRRHDGLLLDGL